MFNEKLLKWFDLHGRKDLPWQQNRTPYRVWVSEIMLQQTQVASVIPYFQRFMKRFPDVRRLADADLDEVLHYWAGLGYYSRARNLHRAAKIILDNHNGQFPLELDQVQALPGVGRSTAGAILALSNGQRHPILDGNVKRVLTRYLAIPGWPGKADVEKRLWACAENFTPSHHIDDYTQAIMDLGATICTRAKPQCEQCPLNLDCAGYAQGRVAEYPAPKPRKVLPVKFRQFLMLQDGAGGVLLEKRPPTGIWGGLWSFPEVTVEENISHWCKKNLGCGIDNLKKWPVVRHTFSHYHLDISPVSARISKFQPSIMEQGRHLWYQPGANIKLGLAAPVKRLLDQIHTHCKGE